MKKYPVKFLENLYQTMLRIRTCEESFVEPIISGEIKCPVHLYTGEEAIATGVCAALRKDDYIFGSHRSHGHYIAHGGSMKELVAEVYCKETGCAKGRGGSMHVCAFDKGMVFSAPIVGGTISLALGSALASKIRRDNKVTVSFFGDGATGEGVLYESMNFAALKKLPIIFVCENNFYATHMPVHECRINNNINKIAEPFCIESSAIDGNDVLTVYETGGEAVDKCRRGEGPVFIECLTYRFRGHVGPDDNIQGSHTDIRPKVEVEQWLHKDPIVLFEKYLLENKLIAKTELETIREQAQDEVRLAHCFAKESQSPDIKELTKYVFRE